MTPISPTAFIPLTVFLCFLLALAPCSAEPATATATPRPSDVRSKTLSADRNAAAAKTPIERLRPPTERPRVDLRPQMKQMKLKEGKNMVYQGPGYKLSAMVKGGKVARWLATDNNGKPLPTTVAQGVIECQVCVIIKTGTGEAKTCSVVDCSILEKPKTAEKAQ